MITEWPPQPHSPSRCDWSYAGSFAIGTAFPIARALTLLEPEWHERPPRHAGKDKRNSPNVLWAAPGDAARYNQFSRAINDNPCPGGTRNCSSCYEEQATQPHRLTAAQTARNTGFALSASSPHALSGSVCRTSVPPASPQAPKTHCCSGQQRGLQSAIAFRVELTVGKCCRRASGC